jgi:hypothetical protein
VGQAGIGDPNPRPSKFLNRETLGATDAATKQGLAAKERKNRKE